MLEKRTLNEIGKLVNEAAHEKGWYDGYTTEDEYIQKITNNMHCEVCELYEAWRKGNLHEVCDKGDKMREMGLTPLTCAEEELADIIIRACDNAHHLGIDLGKAVDIKYKFNKERPYRHGGKKS